MIDKGNFIDLFIKPRISSKDLKYFSALFCWGNYDYQKYIKFFKEKNFI